MLSDKTEITDFLLIPEFTYTDPRVKSYFELTPIQLNTVTTKISCENKAEITAEAKLLRAVSKHRVNKLTFTLEPIDEEDIIHSLQRLQGHGQPLFSLIVSDITFDDNRTHIKCYAAQTADHGLLAGVMMDAGVPLEDIRTAISNTEAGFILPIGSLGTSSLHIISDAKDNEIRVSGWGIVPIESEQRRNYLNMVVQIAQAVSQISLVCSDNYGLGLKQNRKMSFYDNLAHTFSDLPIFENM